LRHVERSSYQRKGAVYGNSRVGVQLKLTHAGIRPTLSLAVTLATNMARSSPHSHEAGAMLQLWSVAGVGCLLSPGGAACELRCLWQGCARALNLYSDSSIYDYHDSISSRANSLLGLSQFEDAVSSTCRMQVSIRWLHAQESAACVGKSAYCGRWHMNAFSCE